MSESTITKESWNPYGKIIEAVIYDTGKETVDERKLCARTLRLKGVPYRVIGKVLGVSDVCIYQYVNAAKVKDNRERAKRAKLPKRPFTDYCELCGTHMYTKFTYHNWLKDFPELGLWLCYACHFIAKDIDESKCTEVRDKETIIKYNRLKVTLSVEHFKTEK